MLLSREQFKNELSKLETEKQQFAIALFNKINATLPDKKAAYATIFAVTRPDWYLMDAEWAIELYENAKV